MNEAMFNDRLQFKVVIALSIVVLALVYCSDTHGYQRFLGATNPLPIFAVVSLLGIVSLALLLSQGRFVIYRAENWKGLPRYFALALLFGGNAILIDLNIVFPADMNVPFPASLLFYPAIDFLVQIVFHVLPLTLLLFASSWLFKKTGREKTIWIGIVVVALLEPIYQMIDMHSVNSYSLWAVVLVGLHVYVINFVELLVFKRYDFVAMYLFRLVFYAAWHIVWGAARLELLY